MRKPEDELIEKFLQSRCTKQEADLVREYLNANPDHPYLLKEWAGTDGHTALPENYTQEMFAVVKSAIENPEKKAVNLWWGLAAAVCMSGIIFSIWLLAGNTAVEPAMAERAPGNPESAWTTQYNTLQKELILTLADSSVVSLSPNASIRYRKNFNTHDSREIYMTGQAFFRVAKNKQKPFIVYSNNLSTTALGTAFSVTAPETAKAISVRLFEGKVVVKPGDAPGTRPANVYYLTPGQELLFDTKSRSGFIQSFFKKNSIGKTVNKKIIPETAVRNESYMFNNQTLAEVLDELSAMYHVEIDYSKAITVNKYFIGKVDRSDSLEKIINDITLLNKLSVTKQNGRYILRKK